MKPRQQSAPLTTEDQLIFNWWCECLFQRYQRRGQFAKSLESDRRDADMMLEAVNLSRCPIWSGRFESPCGGRWFDRIMKARECVQP